MTAPEPSTVTQNFAEKVARANVRRMVGRDAWEELDPVEQERELIHATSWLEVIAAAGIAVVELPEVVVSDESRGGIRTVSSFSEGRGYSVTGWDRGPEDSYVALAAVGWWDLDFAELDALRVLAVVAEMRRLRAEHHGGESR